MIELKGISKSYHISDRTINAVLPVDLTVRKGEFVSLVGHSGSGKSTFLSLLGGIAKPDTGVVLIEGKDIWKYDDRRMSRMRNETFGFVYQFASLLPTLNAEENVLLPTVFGGQRRRDEALRLLEAVGLGDKAGRYPSELSGGEQQRVAIARAFINAPGIILADEPTGDLDEETEADIMTFFETMNRERNVTILLVTHSSELARRATRRLRMKQGMLGEAV